MAQPSDHILDLILNRQAQLSAAPVRVQRRALPALQARVEASREHSVDTDDPFAGMQRCRQQNVCGGVPKQKISNCWGIDHVCKTTVLGKH